MRTGELVDRPARAECAIARPFCVKVARLVADLPARGLAITESHSVCRGHYDKQQGHVRSSKVLSCEIPDHRPYWWINGDMDGQKCPSYGWVIPECWGSLRSTTCTH